MAISTNRLGRYQAASRTLRRWVEDQKEALWASRVLGTPVELVCADAKGDLFNITLKTVALVDEIPNFAEWDAMMDLKAIAADKAKASN